MEMTENFRFDEKFSKFYKKRRGMRFHAVEMHTKWGLAAL